jgi:hypothetical protein
LTVRAAFRAGDLSVDETFSGATPEDVVAAMQSAVSRRAPLAMRLALGLFTPLRFAQLAVERYGETSGRALPIPATCAEFITLAQSEGFAVVVDP